MDENFRDVAFWPFNNGIGIGLNHRHESISTEIRRNRDGTEGTAKHYKLKLMQTELEN